MDEGGQGGGKGERLVVDNLNCCSCLSVMLQWLNALNEALAHPFPRQDLAIVSPRLLLVCVHGLMYIYTHIHARVHANIHTQHRFRVEGLDMYMPI